MKPLYLNIGAMKAGTTWLYSILVKHPSLYFTPEKEIHFLAQYYGKTNILSNEIRLRKAKEVLSNDVKHLGTYKMYARWYAMYLESVDTIDWYLRIFSLNKTKEVNCDFSNLTCMLSSEDWKDLSSKFDVKAVYILRDPFSRLWSHLKFHYMFTNQPLDFSEWAKSQFESIIKKQFLWEAVTYDKYIKSLQNGLSANQYKIIYFEDLVGEPEKWLKCITDFIGVSPINYSEYELHSKVNKSKSLEVAPHFEEVASSLLKPIYDELRDMGYSHPKWSQ